MDRTFQILAITKSGNVKGYIITPNKEGLNAQSSASQKAELSEEVEVLMKKKNALAMKA